MVLGADELRIEAQRLREGGDGGGHVIQLGPGNASAAQAALAQAPDHFELLDRLGQAQLQVGAQQQAVGTFNRMVALQGKSPLGYLGLAEAQLAANDPASASRSARRALEVGQLDAVITQNVGHLARSALRVLRAKADRGVIDEAQEQLRIEIVIRENLPPDSDDSHSF